MRLQIVKYGSRGLGVIWAAAAFAVAITSTAQAAFPGANGRIVFSSDRDDLVSGPNEIFTVRPDGTGLRKLTEMSRTGGRDIEPAWSPDGRRIAFVRAAPDARVGGSQLYVMNADGSGLTKVPNTGINASNPSWSPDGERLAFANKAGELCGFACFGRHIFSVRLDGTGLTELTTALDDSDPAWSPDGTEIAFASDRFTDDLFSRFKLIFKMRSDGSDQRRLSIAATPASDPNWSPDGRRITFEGFFRIFAVDSADGANPITLTSRQGQDFSPAWSPDGTRIVLAGRLLADWPATPLWTMNPDGTDIEHLTPVDGHFDGDPDWQPVPPGNRPPSCAGVTATPSELSPADGSMRLVALAGADPDGDRVAISITGVTQDEPVRGGPDKTAPDAAPGQAPNEVRLRAERRNGRDGRVYRIHFTAEDILEAQCSGTAKVSVRKQPKRPAVDSAPPSFDSFGL